MEYKNHPVQSFFDGPKKKIPFGKDAHIVVAD
jgi:hypothetical protein